MLGWFENDSIGVRSHVRSEQKLTTSFVRRFSFLYLMEFVMKNLCTFNVSAHQGRDVGGLDAGRGGLDSALVRLSQASAAGQR